MEWILELVLAVLLAATLFHALRLERALGVLKRDRASLEALVAGFNASTQAAEQSVAQLKAAADGAGRHLVRHMEQAVRLKDDLNYLAAHGNTVADRLERAVREGRDPPQADRPAPLGEVVPYTRADPPPQPAEPRPRSRAEQELMRALRLAR